MTDSNTDSSDDEDRRSTEDVYREIHDWTSADSLSSTLLTALADVKDVAPTDLEPLYETLDPEALDNLFGSDGDGFRADGHVSFPVAGCDVSIYSHGEFAVISIKKSPESVDFGGGGGELGRHSVLQIESPRACSDGCTEWRSSGRGMGGTPRVAGVP